VFRWVPNLQMAGLASDGGTVPEKGRQAEYPSMLINEICDFLMPAAALRSIADVRIGLGYTAVRLDDGHCGLSYTFRNEIHEGCCVIREAGTLSGRPASLLAEWTRSTDPIASAAGLATLNALTDVPPGAAEADLLAELHVASSDAVGMVGYFGPLVSPLRSRGRILHIFERRPHAESGVLPESATAEILPQCNVVILSATTLLNRTLDGLLDHCRNAREVAILGPSTPLLPEVFLGRRLTLLSGVCVVDHPDRVLRIVSEGGGTRQFGGAVRKVTLRLPVVSSNSFKSGSSSVPDPPPPESPSS
jgi:uncharacterized protein (DUF4213/DUF364 family)